MRLSRADLQGALDFVGEVGALETEEPFPSAVLDRLASLLRCQGVAYCEIDRARSELVLFTATCPKVGPPEEVYWQTVHEHPIRIHRQRTGDLRALKIYDFVTARELRRTQFYADFIRPWGTPFVMTLGLPCSPGWTSTFVLDREEHDFGERERSLLDLLQPHLARLRRASEARLRARVAFAEADDDVLTEREAEILTRVADGLRNREIAELLWIAPGTVRRHLDNIYAKLDAHTRTAAVRIARDRGLLPDGTGPAA